MTLDEVKNILPSLETVSFRLEDGTLVPAHFHITEIGMITKAFIDCGGVVRKETKISFQLWNADDFDHRLKPAKLLNIIRLSEEKLGIENAEIEVEYQLETIGKFNLGFDGKAFVLQSTKTTCLASDNCGIPAEKPRVDLSQLISNNSCAPNSGCC